ncbi:hypothetical protein FK521_30525, partial [Klebsiella pneumoniae]|nr:hypothetical protein [Klebsiella pneumoniae]
MWTKLRTSPQRLQNLVNYHPIFCPNAGDCSFFVLFVNEGVLSNGHGSMLIYSLLHLTGYDLPISELKN